MNNKNNNNSDSPISVITWDKPETPSEQEVEAFLQKEGFHTFRWHDVPGMDYPRHRHAVDECIMMIKGKIKFKVNEEWFELNAGDRIYLPKNIPHSALVPDDKSATYIVGQKKK